MTDGRAGNGEMPAHLRDLDERQLDAATSKPGPLRLVAGPGAGKTRAIVSRIVEMVLGGADPSRILAVTFTNMAAEEMRSRLAASLGDPARKVWLGTFHAMAARIIRRLGAEEVGLTARFTIWDEQDRKAELREILRAMMIEQARRRIEAGTADAHDIRAVRTGKPRVKAENLKSVVDLVESARNLRLGPQRMREVQAIGPADIEAFRRYEERLKAANAVDFGLILCKALDLSESVRTGPEMAAMFDHVFVDEFQDADHVQSQIAYFLARRTRSITVVGDEDQTLFSWRGAERGSFLHFADEWGEATKTILMERNYRSTNNIVSAARSFIASNPGRVDKSIFTEAAEGRPIRVVRLADAPAEADHVLGRVRALAAEGVPLREIAVLYRSRGLYDDVEKALRRARIPHRIVKGLRFYDRKAVKDATCWLRLAVSRDDDAALQRVANVPARGISARRMEAARRWAHAHGASLAAGFAAMVRGAVPDAPKGSVKPAARLLSLLDAIAPLAALSPPEALAGVMELSGYRAWLQEVVGDPEDAEGKEQALDDQDAFDEDAVEGLDDDDEDEPDDCADEGKSKSRARARTALKQLDDLADDAAAFVFDENDGQPSAVGGFLQQAALMSESEEKSQRGGRRKRGKDPDGVQIMTVHSSKGREYDHVFMIAMEENIFPAYRSIVEEPSRERDAMRQAAGRPDERAEGGRAIDEEQRLCYVGITRARKEATLTYVGERFHFGEYKCNAPSRYVDALLATGRCQMDGSDHRSRRVGDGGDGDNDGDDHPWRGYDA